MSVTDKVLAPGDRLREWWDGLPRMQKWAFGFVLFGALALLPLYTPPFLDTPGISFGGTMAQFVDPDGNSFVLRGTESRAAAE